MSNEAAFDLSKFPIHLGLGATVVRQPAFSGMEWYGAYTERTESDGVEGRLVTVHSFSEPWTSWEMHPKGHELVVCIEGRVTLHQEIDGKVHTVTLEKHQAAINLPGVWHTADVEGSATCLFITAGVGTQHRPR